LIYNYHGNLRTLSRYQNGSNKLDLQYSNVGNHMVRLTGGGGSGLDYLYDANGNLGNDAKIVAMIGLATW
jgi:hypothetical protein